MLINTKRFGPLEVADDKIITFKDGLLGFPQARRFALIQTAVDPVFYWLQSVEDPKLAFIVCDPSEFVEDYEVPIRADDLRSLEMRKRSEHQLLVIVNRVRHELTANLLGPLVVSLQSLQGKQMVLSDKRFGTRHPLVRLNEPQAISKTA